MCACSFLLNKQQKCVMLAGSNPEAASRSSQTEVVNDDIESHLENDLDPDLYDRRDYSHDDVDKYVNTTYIR